MKPETLAALLESIAHWKRMRDNPHCGDQPSGKQCALCRRFINHGALLCSVDSGPTEPRELCPVAKRTERHMCMGTPYHHAAYMFSEYIKYQAVSLKTWRAAAQEEINFLENLLPQEYHETAKETIAS